MAYPFVQARNFTRVGGRTINLVVVHDMEAPETAKTAETVAAWFAGPTAPRASAHYCIDNDSIVQCVRDMDVAWHAPGANHDGIGLEHAGYARQSRNEWLDPFGTRMLALSAKLAADLCTKYQIPIRHLSAADLLRGERGITGHADVTQAYHRSTHTDPGGDFPWDTYLALVKAQRSRLAASVAQPVSWKWQWARWKLGEGEYRKCGPGGGARPATAPRVIPPWAWAWLAKFLLARKRATPPKA